MPRGINLEPDGNLYVSSAGTDEVLRYGVASLAAFTVSLSSPSALPVTVDYSTADGTAIAGSDYTAASGTDHVRPRCDHPYDHRGDPRRHGR